MNSDNRPNQLADDADPIIDALLAEFVPENPDHRKTPPDLSGEILRKLAALQTDGTSEVSRAGSATAMSSGVASGDGQPSVKNPRGNSSESRFSAGTIVSIIVAVAASLLGLIWFAGQDDTTTENSPRVAENVDALDEGARPDASLAQAEKASDSVRTVEKIARDDSSKRKNNAPKGIRLDAPDDTNALVGQEPSSSLPGKSLKPAPSGSKLESIASVSKRLEQLAFSYWDSLDVTPTAEANASELAARFGKQLDVTINPEHVSQVRQLEQHLSKRPNTRRLASKWLANALGQKTESIRQNANAGLVKELGLAFSPRQSFSTTFVSLVDGSSDNASTFYNLLDGRSRNGGDKVGLAHQLASLTMNSDLRCVRCHDSLIGRAGTQEDHWSFVTLLRKSVMRTNDGWKFESNGGNKAGFFELPDGRMQMVQPAVSSALFDAPEPPKDLGEWARQLASSPQFAGSIVDSLWKMVHQRKLSPSAVDVFAPPTNESLTEIRDELVRDLIASDFDVTRTLALIVSSPMNRRSVPASLLPANSLTASDDDRALAMEQVGAFAAAVDKPVASRRQRMDLAIKRFGGALKKDADSALLAQPIIQSPKKSLSSSPNKNPMLDFSKKLSVDFPGNEAALPVAWLSSIDDYDQQVAHLAYLAGEYQVPKDIAEIATKLQTASSTESALSRLWWILND